MQTNWMSTIMIYKQKNKIIHNYFKMDFEIKQIIIIQIQVYINQINNTQEDKKLKINILNRFTKIESYPIIIINLN
jgi:cytochrome b subunit of formate dehydrogenase